MVAVHFEGASPLDPVLKLLFCHCGDIAPVPDLATSDVIGVCPLDDETTERIGMPFASPTTNPEALGMCGSAPSEEDGRVSLAFNLMPRGCYGHGDSTYNTEWMR